MSASANSRTNFFRTSTWNASTKARSATTSSAAKRKAEMQPRRYGPFAYVPIHRRPRLEWPNGAQLALWINPNIEYFGLDDVMPGNTNERVARDHAKVP